MEHRVTYIVIAHKNPHQVVRLLHRLASDRTTFVVHVDRRAGSDVEDAIRNGARALGDVRFLDRRRCFWGGFGMVAATVAAFDELVRGSVAFDHAVLLSGQDYPLRSAADIERFLGAAAGRCFMTHAHLPTPFWPDGGLNRIEQFHLVSHHALHLTVPWRRRIPGGLDPFGGGAWHCLARPVVEHVVAFIRSNPTFVRFFEHVLHPDELFFQTIVMNSPFAPTVVDDHLRYVDWADSVGSPAVLETADLGRLIESDKLFARKFDTAVDSTILDLLDEHIGRASVAPAR
jgi:core-2/I-Branching enzyme